MDLAELKVIVDRIAVDLEICAQALETLRPIGVRVEERVLEKFKDNYSAHVVSFLQTALHRDALLSMLRMWDDGKDTQSISRVMRELQTGEVVDEIKTERRDANRTALVVDDWITEVTAMCDEPALRELLDRHINWRNKNVAHALETTRKERAATKSGVVIVDPKWGDLYDLKDMTNQIVLRLMLIVADTSIFPEESEQIFARYAEAFWGSFVEEPQ